MNCRGETATAVFMMFPLFLGGGGCVLLLAGLAVWLVLCDCGLRHFQ